MYSVGSRHTLYTFSAFCRFPTHTVHIQCIPSVPDTHCTHSVHSVGSRHTVHFQCILSVPNTHCTHSVHSVCSRHTLYTFSAFRLFRAHTVHIQTLLLHPIRKQRSMVKCFVVYYCSVVTAHTVLLCAFRQCVRLRYWLRVYQTTDAILHTSVKPMLGTCPENYQYQGLNFARIWKQTVNVFPREHRCMYILQLPFKHTYLQQTTWCCGPRQT